MSSKKPSDPELFAPDSRAVLQITDRLRDDAQQQIDRNAALHEWQHECRRERANVAGREQRLALLRAIKRTRVIDLIVFEPLTAECGATARRHRMHSAAPQAACFVLEVTAIADGPPGKSQMNRTGPVCSEAPREKHCAVKPPIQCLSRCERVGKLRRPSTDLATAMLKLAAIPLLFAFASPAFAEACLNTDKQGGAGDARHYDYQACKPTGVAGGQQYNSVGIIGGQMADIMSRRSADDVYTDEERAANRKALQAFAAEQDERRARVKLGAYSELGGYADKSVYSNAAISVEQQTAIRSEIAQAIEQGKLIETFGARDYASAATWRATDPVERWKNCEVATVLAQAYFTGELATPQQMDPTKGYAIAKAGDAANCGGTAYWLGRAYEAGDTWVKGIDKELGKNPKWTIVSAYGTAIVNGYSPAYRRMADLWKLGGPERYRGKTYLDIMAMTKMPYWRQPDDSDERFLTLVLYTRCLEADPSDLHCAQQLAAIYADDKRDFLDGFTTYDAKRAKHYEGYVSELQTLIAQASKAPVTP